MNDQAEAPEITPEIVDQLRTVRDSGASNMMDVSGVQRSANARALYALTIYCEDILRLPGQSKRAKAWMLTLETAFPKD
jgi:hypothetical protein